MGGGFGSKIFCYNEETMVTWAASRVGRPIKWTAERSESFMTDAHGRDHVTHAELALDKDGKFLALKVDTIANMGAYLSTFSTAVPTYLYATLLAGQYTTPVIYANVRAALTHTAPVDAYRGAGRPEATFVIESIVSKAAAELKIDAGRAAPEELHSDRRLPVPDAGGAAVRLRATTRRSSTRRSRSPTTRASNRGGPRPSRAASCAASASRPTSRPAAWRPSRVIGQLGGGVGQWESAQIKFNPTGNVQVMTGAHSHGQGHETTFAQIVSDKLGVPMENIEVVHGDTATTPFGMGTYGSRSLAVGGSAIMKAADKIIAKGKKIAAHLMEADVADVVFEHGTFKVAGTDKNVPLGAGGVRGLRAAQLSARGARARHGRERLLRSVELRLSGRHADLRGRDRPRHRRRSRS